MQDTERGNDNSNEEERTANLPINDAEVADVDDESAMVAEVLGTDATENLRPEARQQIARFVANVTSVGITGFNPILRAITSEHLSKMIDNRERSDERAHTSEESERKYQFRYFLIAIIAALVLIILFIALIILFSVRGDSETLINILLAVMGLVGGFGLGRTTRRD